MKTHFKTTTRVKTPGMHLSRRAYVPLFSKPIINIHIAVLPVTFWPCLRQKNATSFSDLQRLSDLNIKSPFKPTRRVKTSGMHLSKRTYVPLFSKPSRTICFSPTSHLVVMSTPENITSFSDLQRLFYLNMKTHFKTIRGKGLRVPSRTTVDVHYLPFTAFHLLIVAIDIIQ